jgi:hypothetical protein
MQKVRSKKGYLRECGMHGSSAGAVKLAARDLGSKVTIAQEALQTRVVVAPNGLVPTPGQRGGRKAAGDGILGRKIELATRGVQCADCNDLSCRRDMRKPLTGDLG